ncbi:MAG: hypothetical protein AAFV07_12465 [Bacteroidota bacterium]
MEKRKVVQLVQLLNPKEQRRFEKWLTFELDGKQRKTLTLYQLLCKQVSVKKLWQSLFPGIPQPEQIFNDSTLRRVEHQLAVMLEKYLALQALDRDPESRDLFLIKELNQRNARELFTQKLKKARLQLNKNPLRNERYYQQLYRLVRQEVHFLLKFKNPKVGSAFFELNRSFETWWMHEKMRMALNAVNFRRVLNRDSGSLLVDEVMQISQETPYLQDLPVLQIYQRLYQLLVGGAEPGNLLEMLDAHREELGVDVLTDAFTLLLNYYTSKSNKDGQRPDLENLFFTYEWGIREGYLLPDGVLSWQHYKNLVTVGLRLQKTQEVWDYLHSLRDLLPPRDAEEAFEFNLGKYYIAVGEYGQARRMLARKFSHVFYEVSGRLALIKLGYEEGQRDELENELRALRLYVDRQSRISPLQKAGWTNEIRLIEKLIKVYLPKERELLKEEIHQTHPLGNRAWLTRQLTGLPA